MAYEEWHNIPIPLNVTKESKKVLSFRLKGKAYFLASHDNQYYAGYLKCPHAGGDLSRGKILESGEIVCPLHRYAFDLKTGRSKEGFCIEHFPVKVENGNLMIGFKKRGWFNF